MMENSIKVEGNVGVVFEDPVLLMDFDQRQAHFVEGLRRDSLACGAIPNPHALVPIPRIKKLALITNRMFLNGLPKGWGG